MSVLCTLGTVQRHTETLSAVEWDTNFLFTVCCPHRRHGSDVYAELLPVENKRGLGRLLHVASLDVAQLLRCAEL